MQPFAIGVVTALLLGSAVATADDQQTAKDAASGQATSWIELVDAGKYAESWDQAAAAFRDGILKDKWVEAVGKARGPLGALVSRKPSKADYTETLPGAPDGKYVIVQYDTTFEKKKNATETAILSLENDGAWRVAGYFIK
jgi:hypothetical protein